MEPRKTGSLAILFKTLLFTIVAPAVVAGYVPFRILRHYDRLAWPPPASWRWVGLAVAFAGAWGYARCALDFSLRGRGTPFPLDPPTVFVAEGHYRYTRNPMYVSVVALIAGEAILFRSHQLAIWGALVFIAFYLFVVAYEEGALRERFGESYEAYREHVPRWLPRLPRPTA